MPVLTGQVLEIGEKGRSGGVDWAGPGDWREG